MGSFDDSPIEKTSLFITRQKIEPNKKRESLFEFTILFTVKFSKCSPVLTHKKSLVALANPRLVLVPGCPCRTAGWTKNHVLSSQSVCVLLGQKEGVICLILIH